MRYNATAQMHTNDSQALPDYWASKAVRYTEWHQDDFTRMQGSTTGQVYSRIDRIYSNHSLSLLYDADIFTTVVGTHGQDNLSDHLAVRGRLQMKNSSTKNTAPVPLWVADHKHFWEAWKDAAAQSPFQGDSPVDEVLWCKQVMRNATNRVLEK
eukprot:7104965-Karenia_brevis.AAC.1